MERLPVHAGSTGGRYGRKRSGRGEQLIVHVFATAILLATTSIGVAAGKLDPPISIDRADHHGVRPRPAEASLKRGSTPPARGSVKSSPTTPAWEFLGVWGGEGDIVAESPMDSERSQLVPWV